MKKLLLAPLFLFLPVLFAQETPNKPVVSKASNQTYAPVHGVPDCATLAVLRGDPDTSASVVEIKLTPGCIVPWHWHSVNENVVPLTGLLEMYRKDEKPMILVSGDYNFLPAKSIHQDKCSGSKPCSAMVFVDGPFDIHYVDKSGAEIPADQAVAAAQKQTSKPAAKPTH
jgi:quercetin dioxygenase-like cupin family protein